MKWVFDFAGSPVHSVADVRTAGAMLGFRDGKYASDGSVNVIPGCSLPMTTLGVFILWLGWFGFNGGSISSWFGADATAADIFVNTTWAVAGGVLACMIVSKATNSHTNIVQHSMGQLQA